MSNAATVTVSESAEPGQEPNLVLLHCERCQEPMQHLCEIWGVYPLCIWWVLNCGECGKELNAWEDLPVPPRFQTRRAPLPAEEVE
jgi:hypothetical protein